MIGKEVPSNVMRLSLVTVWDAGEQHAYADAGNVFVLAMEDASGRP